MAPSLQKIIQCADQQLRTTEIEDYPGAYNGLQIENNGVIMRLGAAVDASEEVLRLAIERGVDLLLVHHGLFWGKTVPLTEVAYRKIKLCLDHNLAVYSSHLPLDLHPRLGNNILLAQSLGFKKTEPFFEMFGSKIGRRVAVDMTMSELARRLEKAVQGPVRVIEGGPKRVRRLAVITGGAGSEVAQVAALGIDILITGEGPHYTYALAHEHRINLLYAGHYATETFGVKALAGYLSRKFRLPWEWIDCPSGL